MTIQGSMKVLLLSIVIVGCTTVSNMMKEKQFNQTADSFHYAMRWSEFKTAIAFRKDIVPGEISSTLEQLKPIKITSFSIIETVPMENKNEILEVAEIQYYKSDTMKEKTVVAQILWEYDSKKETWYIVKGWPEFN